MFTCRSTGRLREPDSGSPDILEGFGLELDEDEDEAIGGEARGDVDEIVGLTNIDLVPSTKRPPRGGLSSRGCFGDAAASEESDGEEGPAPGDCGGLGDEGPAEDGPRRDTILACVDEGDKGRCV